MNKTDQKMRITILVAAQRTGLSVRTVRRYIRCGLVNSALTKMDLEQLRRIRRLTELGVNLAGVEIILHMRRQIEELLAERERLEAHLLSRGGQDEYKRAHFDRG
jgi:MerR family transcriptional regulator/heat shock protein HspR